jgi:hypothetical protein
MNIKEEKTIDPGCIYTPLSDILVELERRRNDKDLIKKVEDFLQEDKINDFGDFEDVKVVFNRPLITPNKELKYFFDIIQDLDLKPLFFEYNGVFVSRNKDKYNICHVRNAKSLRKLRFVDFNIWEGKLLKDIMIKSQVKLHTVHREALCALYPGIDTNIFDITDWFNAVRHKTEYYYLHFLAHFICHGVLFENFLLENPHERDFFEKKVLPSFNKLTEIFGVRPLIFPLLPIENARLENWLWYNDEAFKRFKKYHT